jgi:hypothetical protein
MSGDDRRTTLPGRIEKIRELIASFFRAFTQDEVHHACLPEATVQHRTESVNIGRPPVMRRGEAPGLGQDDLTTYRRLAHREDSFGILRARSLRTKASQL